MEDTRGRSLNRFSGYQLDREQIWILRQRAQFMGRNERIFLEMILERGSSCVQMAHLTGQNDASIRRRLRRLIARLISRQTLTALRDPHLTPQQRSIARAYYLQGLSQPQVARKTASSEYFVRKTLRQIRAVAHKAE